MISRLSTKLLLLLLLMVMTMMKSPYASATIEMEIQPETGLTFGEDGFMSIECRTDESNPLSFALIRNDSEIVRMQHNKSTSTNNVIYNTDNFHCYANGQNNSYVFSCSNWNVTCNDVGSYRCSVNDIHISSAKTLAVKSYIKSLQYVDGSSSGRKYDGFSCQAVTGLDPGTRVTFEWETFNLRSVLTEMTTTETVVPDSGKCYSEVSSFLSVYIPKIMDIRCSVFGESHCK
ncbi:uncharacterized protein LOC118767027 [Octopus sinensis]|uniref:Uncharacterized protein LOC118767027 n=1 Tax=Octopus sinensis TaxID=2607531 RepID=A0A7E6FGW9_9MOLL|nr:uncharacterized protein LOC118767027 [Octopus sinensis]